MQLALVSVGFSVVTAVMIWGSFTRSTTTKRVLFWTLLIGLGSASYFLNRI
jgi:hypothetical protein